MHAYSVLGAKKGESGESNPGPLAPKARIIPLDHTPAISPVGESDHHIKNYTIYKSCFINGCFAIFQGECSLHLIFTHLEDIKSVD
jgi:hypothetical protein